MTRDENDEVVVERDLGAPIDKIWRALTIPELVAEWLLPLVQDVSEPDVLRLDGAARGLAGAVSIRIVEVEPRTRILYSWFECGEPPGLVAFDLEPLPDGGARLRVTHTRHARTPPRAANTNVCTARVPMARAA
ncbi:SRPBCC family protein [Salinarimonas chemoclinalis]|uniref:SRPBCC family protein n=1 Tax=Salinarimonas chemoclinalis TaxID=3241599 RepID=UPI0035587600